MYKILKMMLGLLNHNEKKRLLTLLIITFFVSIFDVAGVASIAPFFSLVSQPEMIETNNILSNIFYFFGFNDVNSSEDIQNFLIIIGAGVFIFMVASLSMKAWSIYMLERFAQSCNFNISKNFVENYLRQDYSWFLNKNSASIGKNILSEVNAVVSGILLPGLMFLQYFLCHSYYIRFIYIRPSISYKCIYTSYRNIFNLHFGCKKIFN